MKVGLFLLVLQVVLQIVSGQDPNLDDNRTIREELPPTGASTNAPRFASELAKSGPEVTKLNGTVTTAEEKETQAPFSVEVSVNERVQTKSSSETEATKASISDLQTDQVAAEQVTDESKHFAELDASVDTTLSVNTHVGGVTEKASVHKTNNFVFPDPIDEYSNNIMLEGHIFGIRDQLMSMIQAALSSGDVFVPIDPLRVDPIANSYEEMGYEGDKVTHIRYIVSYNGKPIHTAIITRLMSAPKIHHHFQKQLEKKSFRQYKEAKPVENKSWIHEHVAAVVIPSCVAFVLIILVIFVVVARKRSSSATKLEEKKKPLTSGGKTEKKCPPPPYSVENPAYDFETSAVMDGYTLP